MLMLIVKKTKNTPPPPPDNLYLADNLLFSAVLLYVLVSNIVQYNIDTNVYVLSYIILFYYNINILLLANIFNNHHQCCVSTNPHGSITLFVCCIQSSGHKNIW